MGRMDRWIGGYIYVFPAVFTRYRRNFGRESGWCGLMGRVLAREEGKKGGEMDEVEFVRWIGMAGEGAGMASDVISCRGRGRGRGFVYAWFRFCVEEYIELRVLQHTVCGINEMNACCLADTLPQSS